MHELRDLTSLPLKRRVHNRERMVRLCEVSPLHDLIALQYQESPLLLFYSYERTKLVGFLEFDGLVAFRFFPDQLVVMALCSDRLLISTYQRDSTSLAFCIKAEVLLWQPA